MTIERIIRKRLKKLKEENLDIDTEKIERELIPLQPEDEVQPRVVRKKKKE